MFGSRKCGWSSNLWLRGKAVDSRFKCDTELTGKCLQGGLEGEAFAGRGVEGPEQGVEIAIAGQGGVPGDVTAEHAVGILDAAALPGAVRIAVKFASRSGRRASRQTMSPLRAQPARSWLWCPGSRL